MHETVSMMDTREPKLEEKVGFLSQSGAYSPAVGTVVCRETHMSWVFLAGDKAYKLKKPVRFPYLDFSTLARRETACRAELRLNRRLAPDVYLGVVELSAGLSGLSLGGPGRVVDWLVVMRRLDERQMLDRAIADGRVGIEHLDRISGVLVKFYRGAARAFTSPADHLRRWEQNLICNRHLLLDRRLGLPRSLVWYADRAQRRFLAQRAPLLAERVLRHRIVDGHGDLRPEHIWLGDSLRIIDCLEFNPGLRAVDTLDELAYLDLELERLGAARAGEYIRRRVLWQLNDRPPEALFGFYRCHRAMVRARLAIAHLLEPHPRTPEKWPLLARTYLRLAADDAARLEQSVFRMRKGRPAPPPGAVDGSLRR